MKEVTYSCDRCDSYIPLVRTVVQISRVSPANISVAVQDNDLCGECLDDLKKWLLTPPAVDATVVATDNP